jgi:magnesium chelatase subunit D
MADELSQLGILLESEGIKSIVVDTKSRFISSGEGEALARTIGARYFYLPRSDATSVFNVVNSVTWPRPQ